jgi:hypothetical protein
MKHPGSKVCFSRPETAKTAVGQTGPEPAYAAVRQTRPKVAQAAEE